MVQHLVLDFDGTITQNDTIANIAEAALEWRKTPEGGRTDLTETWQRIKDSYARDLNAYDHSQTPKDQRTTWQQEIAYLQGRRAAEEVSISRVAASGLFGGFADHDRLFKAGQRDRETGRVHVRHPFTEFIRSIQERAWMIHVVSVNWSASYIKGVLEPWDISSVVANEINLDGSITAPPDALPEDWSYSGDLKTLTTSGDKLEATQHLLAKFDGHCSHYIGDSTTDLECLRVYGGIVMAPGGGGNLVDTLRRIGEIVPHYSEWKGRDICWMHDFHETAS